MRIRLILPLCTVALACGAVACGKKGPPLAPLPNVPAAPTEVSARRTGDLVVIRFRIPRANQGGIQPANIERVDVYAWTPPAVSPAQAGSTAAPGQPPPPGGLQPDEVFRHARLVGSVPVRRPPPPPPEQKEGEPPPPPPPPPSGPGLDQGSVGQVEETITEAELEPLVLEQKPRKEQRVEATDHQLTPPDVGPPLPPPPSRYYVVVGVNRHGRRGLPSQRLAVPLWTPPPPPGELTATIREGGIDVAWTSPGGLRHPLVTNVAPTPAAAATRPGRAPAAATGPPGVGPSVPGAQRGDAAPAAAPRDEDEDEDDDEDDPAAAEEALSRREAAMQQAAEARAAAALASGQAAAMEPAAPLPPGAPGAAPATTATDTSAPQAPGVHPPLAAPGATTEPTTLPSRVPFPWPASGSGFMVYEVQPPGTTVEGVPPLPAVQPFPRPLTATPIRTTTFSDPRVEYGTARCYAVRTVELVGTMMVESASSAPACVTPRDVFPPAAPKSLGAVASEGVISLIWEAGRESDLAGYIVLRGVAGGPLTAITPAPIRETTYRDEKVRRGTRYAYAVVAVDTATPPNRSPESNRVEETAR